MKKISQEEFEEYVKQIIRGEKTRTQVIKELETEYRTLQNKIELLFITNPELYQEYITKLPYTPRERKDINEVELAIEFLKDQKTMEQIADEYNIGMRTLRRKLDKLGKSQDQFQRELYGLCKEMAYNHSHSYKNSPELDMRIEQILEAAGEIESSIKISNIELRRKELLEIEAKYNELCLTMSKTEAAKAMGYTVTRINKLLNELYRIEIELTAKKIQNQFKQSIKVEGVGKTPVTPAVTSNELDNKAIKEPEKE